MKLKILSLILFLFQITLISASETIIKGVSKSHAGQELVVYGYNDYITNTKEKLGFAVIKNDGKFNFKLSTDIIKKVELRIGNKTTWFFISPGGIYNITLDYDKDLNKNSVYDKILSLKFNFPAPTELNQLISKFNRKYDKFIEDNYALFIKRDRSVEPKIKEFKIKTLKEFQQYNSDFVTNYITYSIAGIYNAIDVSYNVYKSGKDSHHTKANIYLEYLDKKPVLYQDPEYNKLFKDFFKGEFKRLTLNVKGIDITESINEKPSYKSLAKALSKYPFLLEDEFKNLFLLNGLLEVSKDKYFNKENILLILEEIQTKSIYKQQQLIASNIIKYVNRKKLSTGVKAPSFSLKNKDNELVSVTDFKDKYIYINFWANWSIPSLKEMKLMKELYEKYKDDIEFVSICLDNDEKSMISFLENNPTYKWTFLHIGKNKQLQTDYNVRTIPTYILIDQEQKILSAPAARPGGNIERATERSLEKIFYELANNK